ncbi:DUF4262 domain-containing protein [Erythrobacter sp. W53]|uniref:DUF4262 domain-containing protein n=1 Tax=Erythrobacter sp. W53 TaxID=3425947 RepID=UPI003D768FCF
MSDLSDFEEGILANIKDHGCQVNHVFDPDGEEAGKSYSIGFPETVGQPEVICFGLDHKLMHSMIDEICRRCREGFLIEDRKRISDLLDGFDCELRRVLPENIVVDHFASAMWYSEHSDRGQMSDAFQIVWPGAVNGLFPWEDGAAPDVIDMQPALYEAAK